ncbi:MAG: HIT domain-containing protein [Candidatus Gygaella obscura]|nr:HIT domain-containing protein [Candidatus Gygaella obscura]
MKKLWAPWRIGYVKQTKKKSVCIFCKREKSMLLKETKYSSAMLNKYPYNNGHILIAPKKHVNDIDKLLKKELEDLMELLFFCKKRLSKIIKPQGFNIGINLGSAAGAGIKNHVHVHLVPRWNADTNFMSTVSNTKVISQSLVEFKKLFKKNG